MTLHMKNPTAGGAAGLDKTSSFPGGIDCPSNAPEIDPAQADNDAAIITCATKRAPNPAVAAVIKDLKAEFAAEAARIASIYAVHFVEDMEIGDLWAAEHDMRGAVLHLREAAAKFREWQGKPLPARRDVA